MANKRLLYQRHIDGAWDWFTALSPLLLIMILNYRWAAVWATLCAAACHMAVTMVFHMSRVAYCHPASSLVCGVLVACCLPSTVPAWVAAVGGCVGGLVTGIPALLARFFPSEAWTCPVYVPAFAGFLAVRWLFAARWGSFVTPALWMPADTAAGATPLTTMGESTVTVERAQRLFWGLEAGSMGHGPVLALLLGAAYLLLRRRLRSWAPLSMLAVVAVSSWFKWGMPVYGWLLGGTLLAAVLLADGNVAYVGWKGQLTLGAIAGGVTVLCRLCFGGDGSAVAVLLASVLTPFLHLGYHKLQENIPTWMQKFAKTKN